ncbi:MAG: hypothetical protein CFE32_14920 [Alphaproteobacteria bacterium PA3]|nr:MAG: hypothetical protein CFE32_14920 [Alphaproteobacteria bacterium PA3]
MGRIDVGLAAILIGSAVASILVALPSWLIPIPQPMLVLFVVSSLLVISTSVLTLRSVWAWTTWFRKRKNLAPARPKVWPALICLVGWASIAAPTPTVEIKVELPDSKVLPADRN